MVRVRTPEAGALRALLQAPDVTVSSDEPDVLTVHGLDAEQVGHIAWTHHLPVYELTTTHASLEEAFMRVTQDSLEFRTLQHEELIR